MGKTMAREKKGDRKGTLNTETDTDTAMITRDQEGGVQSDTDQGTAGIQEIDTVEIGDQETLRDDTLTGQEIIIGIDQEKGPEIELDMSENIAETKSQIKMSKVDCQFQKKKKLKIIKMT
jgi:hypothetical protein